MQGQIPSQLEKQNNLNELASNSSKGKKLSSLQESANKKTERNALKTAGSRKRLSAFAKAPFNFACAFTRFAKV